MRGDKDWENGYWIVICPNGDNAVGQMLIDDNVRKRVNVRRFLTKEARDIEIEALKETLTDLYIAYPVDTNRKRLQNG